MHATKNNNRPKLKGPKVKTSKSLGTKKIVNPKKQNDDGMQFSIQR